jgi:hypothetical protein
MTELIICIGAMVSLLIVWLCLTVMFDVFKAILDIKFELEDINRRLKLEQNYSMQTLMDKLREDE